MGSGSVGIGAAGRELVYVEASWGFSAAGAARQAVASRLLVIGAGTAYSVSSLTTTAWRAAPDPVSRNTLSELSGDPTCDQTRQSWNHSFTMVPNNPNEIHESAEINQARFVFLKNGKTSNLKNVQEIKETREIT